MRESNNFRISVHLAAASGVTFTLIYDELLTRRLGHYEHVINIDPGQVVDDLRVKVNLLESRPLTILNVPEIKHLHENAISPKGKKII